MQPPWSSPTASPRLSFAYNYRQRRELVGHSYGGLVITDAAEAIGNRVRRLVYLDAFVPEDGESMFSRLGSEQERYFRGLVASVGDGWLVPPFTPDDLGVTDPLDVA